MLTQPQGVGRRLRAMRGCAGSQICASCCTCQVPEHGNVLERFGEIVRRACENVGGGVAS